AISAEKPGLWNRLLLPSALSNAGPATHWAGRPTTLPKGHRLAREGVFELCPLARGGGGTPSMFMTLSLVVGSLLPAPPAPASPSSATSPHCRVCPPPPAPTPSPPPTPGAASSSGTSPPPPPSTPRPGQTRARSAPWPSPPTARRPWSPTPGQGSH